MSSSPARPLTDIQGPARSSSLHSLPRDPSLDTPGSQRSRPNSPWATPTTPRGAAPTGDNARSPYTKRQLYQSPEKIPPGKSPGSSNRDLWVETNFESANYRTPINPKPSESANNNRNETSYTTLVEKNHGPGPPRNERVSMETGGSPWKPTMYDKDVAVYKGPQPASQVSSSTDSGYGHAQVFERTGTDTAGQGSGRNCMVAIGSRKTYSGPSLKGHSLERTPL